MPDKKNAKPHHTPLLDQIENGPWPSFVAGIKKEAEKHAANRQGDAEARSPAKADDRKGSS